MPKSIVTLIIAAACCATTPDAATEGLGFELHRGHLIVVPAGIGPLADLRFVVDTGTSRTVIDTNVAAALALQGRATSVRTFGRVLSGSDVTLSELRFGSVRADRLRVVATDLGSMAASLDLPRLDGIVGIDVLGQASFSVDYRRRRLSFGTMTAVRQRIPFTADPVFPVVFVDIGGVPAELIVDTGASHCVLFIPADDRTFEEAGAVAASMLGGTVTMRALLLPEIRLGNWRMRGLPAVVAEAPVMSRPVKGLLAPTALGASFLQFDFSRRELGWRR